MRIQKIMKRRKLHPQSDAVGSKSFQCLSIWTQHLCFFWCFVLVQSRKLHSGQKEVILFCLSGLTGICHGTKSKLFSKKVGIAKLGFEIWKFACLILHQPLFSDVGLIVRYGNTVTDTQHIQQIQVSVILKKKENDCEWSFLTPLFFQNSAKFCPSECFVRFALSKQQEVGKATLLLLRRLMNSSIWDRVMRSTIFLLSLINSTIICATFNPMSPWVSKMDAVRRLYTRRQNQNWFLRLRIWKPFDNGQHFEREERELVELEVFGVRQDKRDCNRNVLVELPSRVAVWSLCLCFLTFTANWVWKKSMYFAKYRAFFLELPIMYVCSTSYAALKICSKRIWFQNVNPVCQMQCSANVRFISGLRDWDCSLYLRQVGFITGSIQGKLQQLHQEINYLTKNKTKWHFFSERICLLFFLHFTLWTSPSSFSWSSVFSSWVRRTRTCNLSFRPVPVKSREKAGEFMSMKLHKRSEDNKNDQWRGPLTETTRCVFFALSNLCSLLCMNKQTQNDSCKHGTKKDVFADKVLETCHAGSQEKALCSQQKLFSDKPRKPWFRLIFLI